MSVVLQTNRKIWRDAHRRETNGLATALLGYTRVGASLPRFERSISLAGLVFNDSRIFFDWRKALIRRSERCRCWQVNDLTNAKSIPYALRTATSPPKRLQDHLAVPSTTRDQYRLTKSSSADKPSQKPTSPGGPSSNHRNPGSQSVPDSLAFAVVHGYRLAWDAGSRLSHS